MRKLLLKKACVILIILFLSNMFAILTIGQNSIVKNNLSSFSGDDVSGWILEDRDSSHGSSAGATGRSIVYDKYDDAFYVFYFDESNCAKYSSICLNKLTLSNNKWLGKFEFDNDKYIVGEHWNGNRYFEGHIAVTATLDNDNYIWVVWGGHADSKYPMSTFRSVYPISSSSFDYESSSSWTSPVTVDTTVDTSYPKIHVSKDNTYLIFMRNDNSKMRCYWSFDKGQTWNNRVITDEYYGNHLYFYDKDDGTDKVFFFAGGAKTGSSDWDGPGNHFFWTTVSDIINNKGAYASTQVASEAPLYDFPITIDNIIGIDYITESDHTKNYGIAFNTVDNNVYISYNRNSNNEKYGVGFFSKKLGSDDAWSVNVVEPFNNDANLEDIEYVNGALYLLAVFKVGSNKFKIKYARSSTPFNIDSWSWINIFDNELPTETNSIKNAFTGSEMIPFFDNNLIAFSIEYDKHDISTSYGDAKNQAGVTWSWFAINYVYTGPYNNPPDKPAKPNGPNSLMVNTYGTYSTSTIDLDDDNVKYGWDWDGDDTVDEWTGYTASGKSVSISQIWTQKGTYNIKVKAIDIHNSESEWSDPLVVYIADSEYDVELSCGEPYQDVKQGKTATYIVKITNTGISSDTYDLTAGSIEDIMCKINGVNADQYNPYLIPLQSGESTTFEVTGEVGENVQIGEWGIIVDAHSKGDTSSYDSLTLTANVKSRSRQLEKTFLIQWFINFFEKFTRFLLF